LAAVRVAVLVLVPVTVGAGAACCWGAAGAALDACDDELGGLMGTALTRLAPAHDAELAADGALVTAGVAVGGAGEADCVRLSDSTLMLMVGV
jgi:hypothetical protein